MVGLTKSFQLSNNVILSLDLDFVGTLYTCSDVIKNFNSIQFSYLFPILVIFILKIIFGLLL